MKTSRSIKRPRGYRLVSQRVYKINVVKELYFKGSKPSKKDILSKFIEELKLGDLDVEVFDWGKTLVKVKDVNPVIKDSKARSS